ncbi:MAG TPA: hypothetical protein VMU27_00755 [Candidatus Paceibacterota bacterium]|nr:hypothetical protein [Candidatus Paceibacterota bacterium]
MHVLNRKYNEFSTSWRAFLRRWFSKDKTFDGAARDICAAIIGQTWNGRFYQTGLGHFDFFWARDFGTVARSLVALGHREGMHATIRWALEHYKEAGYVALCLTSEGIGFDEPFPSSDALAWFLHSVRVAEFPLSSEDRTFLQNDVRRFCDQFLDAETGLVREYEKIAELRDAVHYRRSAYSVTILALLCRELGLLDIPVPELLKRNYVEILKRDYWNGEYFDADFGVHAWSSEANLFPFWLGFIEDNEMHGKVIETISRKGLTDPYPIRYTDSPESFSYYAWERYFMPNYQGTTLWTWLGAIYLQVLYQANHVEFGSEYEKFIKLIEEHHNFPEMLNTDGSWYKTLFYRAEEGMLWAAIFLEIPSGTYFLKMRKESLESSIK